MKSNEINNDIPFTLAKKPKAFPKSPFDFSSGNISECVWFKLSLTSLRFSSILDDCFETSNLSVSSTVHVLTSVFEAEP